MEAAWLSNQRTSSQGMAGEVQIDTTGGTGTAACRGGSAGSVCAVMRPRDGIGRDAAGDGTFGVGRPAWLGRLGNVRNVVRQEMISRQLDRHLPKHPARVLDVGAGQGTQSIRL